MPPFADVTWLEGQDNMPGLVGDIRFIPKSAVDISALTIEDDGVTTAGNITIKTDGDPTTPLPLGRVTTIYCTENTSNVTDADQGDIDGKYAQNMATWFTPGSFKELESFKRLVRNTPGLYILKDTEFNWRLMGVWAAKNPAWTEGGVEPKFIPSLDIPARIQTINGTHGTRGGDRKGTTFEVFQDAPHAPLFYMGDVPENA
jgi:hypothetical protein